MKKTQESKALALSYLQSQHFIEQDCVIIENTQTLAANIAEQLLSKWQIENDGKSLVQSLGSLFASEMYIELYVLLQQILKQLDMEIPTALEVAIHHESFMRNLLNEIIIAMRIFADETME